MNLFGWDTVFVGTIETVNQALARAGNGLIQSFSFTEEGISASGTFGVWSIVPGGSGQLLHLCFPIASGQFTPAPDARGIDLAGINVVLQVPLRWLERQDGKKSRELVFDLRAVAPEGSQDADKISFVRVLPAKRLTPYQEHNFGNKIARYISAHAAQVSFVFASVDPNKLGTAAWLHPGVSEYACIAPVGGDTPMLAILSSVTGRDVSSLPRNVDAGLQLGAGNSAAIAIAGPLLMRHVVAPAIARGLGVGPERLVTDNDGRIRSNGSIDLGGSSCSVTASLTDARITLTYDGGFSPQAGVSITYTVISELDLAIDPASLTLSFRSVGPPITRKDIHKEWWVILLEFLGALSQQTDVIIQMLVQTIELTLATAVQLAVEHSSPDRISLASVIWSGGAKFSPASGDVANALVLRGTLVMPPEHRLDYAEINKAINARATYPKQFSYQHRVGSGSVNGRFSNWSITGGRVVDGTRESLIPIPIGTQESLISMKLTIADGTLKFRERSYSFSGTAEAELPLLFVPRPGKPNVLDLKVDRTLRNNVIRSSDFLGVSGNMLTLAQRMLGHWLENNLGTVDSVFPPVTLDGRLEDPLGTARP